jgi:hypothetical protein
LSSSDRAKVEATASELRAFVVLFFPEISDSRVSSKYLAKVVALEDARNCEASQPIDLSSSPV